MMNTKAEENEAMKTHLMNNYKNKKQQFDSIFDSNIHKVGQLQCPKIVSSPECISELTLLYF